MGPGLTQSTTRVLEQNKTNINRELGLYSNLETSLAKPRVRWELR